MYKGIERNEGISFLFERVNNSGESGYGIGLDIMEENNAPIFCLFDDISCERVWIFCFPIFRIHVPSDNRTLVYPSDASILYAVGKTKEMRIFSSGSKNFEIGEKYFLKEFYTREFRKGSMAKAMIPDGMSFLESSLEDMSIFRDPISYDKKSGWNFLGLEGIENGIGIFRMRTVIEGDTHGLDAPWFFVGWRGRSYETHMCHTPKSEEKRKHDENYERIIPLPTTHSP